MRCSRALAHDSVESLMIVEQREFLAVSGRVACIFCAKHVRVEKRDTRERAAARKNSLSLSLSLSLPRESPVSKITAVQRLRRRVPFCPCWICWFAMFVDRGKETENPAESDGRLKNPREERRKFTRQTCRMLSIFAIIYLSRKLHTLTFINIQKV